MDSCDVFEEYGPPGQPSMVLVLFHSFAKEDQDVDLGQMANPRAWRTVEDVKSWVRWLSEDFSHAQILTVSYQSAFRNLQTRDHTMDVQLPYETFLGAVTGSLSTHTETPVFLVGDSFGCFVIQELCLTAHRVSSFGWSPENDEAERLLSLISGFIFILPPLSAERMSTSHNNPMESRMYLQRTWSDFLRLRETSGRGRPRYAYEWEWKICVLLDKSTMTSKVKTHELWTIDADDALEVHEVGGWPRGKFIQKLYSILHFSRKELEPLYKCLERFLQDTQDEWRRVHKPLQERNMWVGLENVGHQLIVEVQTRDEPLHRLGLTGVAGVGKTTLARVLFNAMKKDFIYTAFVEVGECIQTKKRSTVRAMIMKQMNRWGRQVHSTDWNILNGKKVLLVLDDVSFEVLEQLLRISKLFAQGSWIVGTSRDHSSFDCSDFHIYEVQPLGLQDSVSLFSRLVFPEKEVPVELESKVEQIVRCCGGLPSSLHIVGKHLQGKPQNIWDDVLRAFQSTASQGGYEEDIIEKLLAEFKVSFDSLAETEQNIFLDVAICFHGENLEETLAVLRAIYPGRADSGWANLQNMSLASVVSSGAAEASSTLLQTVVPSTYKLGQRQTISMHEHLRLLGRRLSKQEQWTHQRVTDPETAYMLLEDQNLEVNPIENLTLECPGLKRLPESFGMLHRLKHLKLDSPQLETLPESFGQLDAMENLELTGMFSLKVLPESFGMLHRLKHLKLDSLKLETLPESFGQLDAMENLELTGMFSLKVLPESFGMLHRLKHLKLDSLKLETLPESFGQLHAIENLELKWMDSLKVLPESFGMLHRLKHLKLNSPQLETLPESFGQLDAMENLELTGMVRLKVLPESFGMLHRLKHLKLNSPQLETLPESFGQLRALQFLRLSKLPRLKVLPRDFDMLHRLTHVELDDPKTRKNFPKSVKVEIATLRDVELDDLKTHENFPKSVKVEIATSRDVELDDPKTHENFPKSVKDEIIRSRDVELDDPKKGYMT